MKTNSKTFYITTPIYYPSGDLHIGHLYTTNIAWILRNYKRLQGYDAIMLTGADEHGQKIQKKALENNQSAQEYVDLQNEKFINLWKTYWIDYDVYSRTTSPKHKKAVQIQFTQLLKTGDIVMGKYSGLYSISDEEFLTPTQAVSRNGKYYHPVSNQELVLVSEESYMFKISKYQNWLQNYFKNHPHFLIPNKIEKELENNFLNKGLEDLSVSRSTFSWGIPITENNKHVVYVWLDALNNYITALGYGSEDDQLFKKYWVNGDEIIHVVGKEIARFHAIYWPIILHAAHIKLPTQIVAHGWIVTPEGKMSKSKGNVVDPLKLASICDIEGIKYFFGSQIDIGNDGVFSPELLKNVYNSDLVNNYSNLVSRTTALFTKNLSLLPNYTKDQPELLREMYEKINSAVTNYQIEFDKLEISLALKTAIKLSAQLNKLIDETMPWKLTNNKPELGKVLLCLFNGIYAVTTMLSVVIPQHANKVREILNTSTFDLKLCNNWNKFSHHAIQPFSNIFERI